MHLHVDSRAVVAIVQLVVFVPATVLAAMLCFRHGFGRISGWIYILLLTLARVAGAICQLITYTKPSENLAIAVVVLDSIVISPLLMSLLGLLSRYVDLVNLNSPKAHITKIHFIMIQLLLVAGLVINAVGSSNNNVSASGEYKVPVTTKIGYALYFVCFAAILLILLLTVSKMGLVDHKERRIVPVVAIALPLAVVRIAYSACSAFLHNRTFSILGGSVVVWACMAVIEEILITLLFLGLGFSLPVLTDDQKGPVQKRAYNFRRARRGHVEPRDDEGFSQIQGQGYGEDGGAQESGLEFSRRDRRSYGRGYGRRSNRPHLWRDLAAKGMAGDSSKV